MVDVTERIKVNQPGHQQAVAEVDDLGVGRLVEQHPAAVAGRNRYDNGTLDGDRDIAQHDDLAPVVGERVRRPDQLSHALSLSRRTGFQPGPGTAARKALVYPC